MRRVSLLVLTIILLMVSTSITKASSLVTPPQLIVIVPDFLAGEWQEPLKVFGEEYEVEVILKTPPAEAVLDEFLRAMDTDRCPDLVMVWDGWLGELYRKGILEELGIENAYFPVLYNNQILGARMPWGESWSVVVPKEGEQKSLAYKLLRHPCIWQRPIYKLEEYRAFATLLADRGYQLLWSERREITMEIGGIPVEITVIPSTTKDDTYCELIIARDERGKTYAQTRILPTTYKYTASPTLSSATLKAIHDSFLLSTARLDAITKDRPGYCSQAEDCLTYKQIECQSNPSKCIFDWFEELLSPQELAQLGLTGVKSRTTTFNTAYAWGSRLRAYKIYKAMLTQDGYDWSGRWGYTAARVRNRITYDSGFSWIHGFTLKGTQTLNIIPSGHKFWSNKGVVDMVTSPRVHYVTESLKNLGSFDDTIYVNAPFLKVMSGSEEDEEKPSMFDYIEAIPIDWEMDYDPNTQILTVTFSTQGKACYGIYELCQVCAVGGGEAKTQAKLDGTEIHTEFKLEAYLEGECGIHPCVHGETGGGIGIYLDITYPDPCSVLVTTTIGIGWGGHGDALNIKRETCDVYKIAGPKGSYNICTDQNLQAELSQNEDFTSRYGKPVTGEEIERALNDYKLVMVETPYEAMAGDITFGHMTEPLKVVTVLAPLKMVKGQEIVATVDMSWVENLATCHYYLSFDPSVLEATGVKGGKIGLVEIPVSWKEIVPGTIRIEQSVPRIQGVTGSGHLAKVFFTAVSPGRTQISFLSGSLFDTQGREIPVDWGRALTAVLLPSDINGDGKVDSLDLAKVAIAFGAVLGDERYDADVDLNDDGIIDIFDLVRIGADFGK